MPPPRPYYLNLLLIRLPVGAVASILHRASGALLSLLAPMFLYGLMLSLRSEADFLALQAWLHGWPGRLLAVVCVWALAHHFFAGLRHLGFDLGLGEGRAPSRTTAWASMALGAGVALAFALGTWP